MKLHMKTTLWAMFVVIVFAIILLLPLIDAMQYQRVQVVRVIDGDTIDVLIDDKVERVRYIGVDAPEWDTEGGKISTQINDYLVGDYVDLRRDTSDRDKYGRLLRYVYNLDGQHVGCELVSAGAAIVVSYRPDTKLIGQLWACAR